MKTKSTSVILKRSILFILLLLYFLLIYSQPKYDFRNKTLVSGTSNQVGAVYRFNNVASGVDAFVTIIDITGGITLNDIDGSSGFAEALQPVINIPAKSSGYAEFRINFLVGGTNTPMVQAEVPMTPIDVDGQVYSGDSLFEYDMVQYNFPSAYFDYNFSGTELSISFPSGWVQGDNIAAIDYPGIDTTAKQVMFTVVNGNISDVIFRVGGTNNSTSSRQRLRSVYFQTFYYPNSILLDGTSLQSFQGNQNTSSVDLVWKLYKNHCLKSISLEKSSSGKDFTTIAEFWPGTDGESITDFSFSDRENISGVAYYRLRLVRVTGKVEYSNVLSFKSNTSLSGNFLKIYPTLVKNNQFTAMIQSDGKQQGLIEMLDYSGRVVYKKMLLLENGINNILINNMGSSLKGTFIVRAVLDNKIYTGHVLAK